MRLLYVDLVSGMSGDMMVGAFLDLGVPVSILNETLERLSLPLPKMRAEKKRIGVIEGTRVVFEGHAPRLEPEEMMRAVLRLDEERVRTDVVSMLEILFEHEALIHGRRDIHLHELSDTLIDFVAVAKAMSYLSIDEVYSGPIPFGYGTVKISHGEVPNPPPLTTRILTGFPIYFTHLPFELVTPTGATILKYYVRAMQCPSFLMQHCGIGFGSYHMERPDIVRLFLGERGVSEEVFVVETDLDDMEMEYVGAVADRLRKAGAKDVVYFPINTKKGRIGIRISIICAQEDLETILDLLFRETTTFGVRMRKENRKTLRREIVTVETPYGSVRVKVGYDTKGRVTKKHVEFDDVREIAEREGLPFQKILERVRQRVDVAFPSD